RADLLPHELIQRRDVIGRERANGSRTHHLHGGLVRVARLLREIREAGSWRRPGVPRALVVILSRITIGIIVGVPRLQRLVAYVARARGVVDMLECRPEELLAINCLVNDVQSYQPYRDKLGRGRGPRV